MYAALHDVAVHFNLLHDSNLTQVKQRWVVAPANEQRAAETSDLGGAPRTLKGCPLQDGTHVLLGEAELDQLVAKASRSVELHTFARWVMSKRAYHGALMAAEGHLVLHTLRNRTEVLVATKVTAPKRTSDARELKMADQLIDAPCGQFDPSAFEDHHRQRVLDLIDKKAAGLPTNLRLPKPRKLVATPLAVGLKRSLLELESKEPGPKLKSPKERRSA